MDTEDRLSSLTLTTATGPGQMILAFLKESDQASFFCLSRSFKKYQENAYYSPVDHFVNHLLAELKLPQKKSWWNYQHYFHNVDQYKHMFFTFIKMGIVTLPFLIIQGIRVFKTYSSLSNTLYTSNPDVFCDTLLDSSIPSYCLENRDWDPCTAACEALLMHKSLREKFFLYTLYAASLFLSVPFCLSGIDALHNFIHACKEGNYCLPLTYFPVALQREAQHLFMTLWKRSNRAHLRLSTAHSAGNVLTELKSMNKKYQAAGQAFRFFKKSSGSQIIPPPSIPVTPEVVMSIF